MILYCWICFKFEKKFNHRIYFPLKKIHQDPNFPTLYFSTVDTKRYTILWVKN